jgi:hypothetical protein
VRAAAAAVVAATATATKIANIRSDMQEVCSSGGSHLMVPAAATTVSLA